MHEFIVPKSKVDYYDGSEVFLNVPYGYTFSSFRSKIKVAGRGRDIIKSSSAKSRPDSQTELNISVLVLIIIISIILRCF